MVHSQNKLPNETRVLKNGDDLEFDFHYSCVDSNGACGALFYRAASGVYPLLVGCNLEAVREGKQSVF